MGTTQPLTLLVDRSISEETLARWLAAGHAVAHIPDVEQGYDGIVSERAWRANDEMLKSTESMMFKAMRAEKRVRTPKKAKAPRKARKVKP
jgi:hypothetical protein